MRLLGYFVCDGVQMTPLTSLEKQLSERLSVLAKQNVELKRTNDLLLIQLEELRRSLNQVLAPGVVRVPMTTLEHESKRAVAERSQQPGGRDKGGQ